MFVLELATSRLLLKGVSPQTIHYLFRHYEKEEILNIMGADEVNYELYKSMHEKGMETHRISLFFFLMQEKESGEIIGDCGFHTWNATHRRAEVFYYLREDKYKQKGFMKEALASVLEYGFTQMNLHRVEALVAHDNIPSLKLLQHYGFSFEGTMREDYCVNGINENSDCYSLLKQEWKK